MRGILSRPSITSKDNPKIKFLASLQQKKYRDEANVFAIENAKTILDAVAAGYMPESLYVSESCFQADKDVVAILKKVSRYEVVADKLQKLYSSLETPSGICAVYRKLEGEINSDQSVIYLDAIRDPGNMGTILRTAVAFGVKNVVLGAECADLYNSKTISASKEALFKLSIVEDKELGVLRQLKGRLPIVVSRLEQATKLDVLTLKQSFCLVLGNEAHGVSTEVAALADQFVSIPMAGDMESLNVAVSCGILLYTLSKMN